MWNTTFPNADFRGFIVANGSLTDLGVNTTAVGINDAGTVIIADVYAAGEQPMEGFDKDALVDGIVSNAVNMPTSPTVVPSSPSSGATVTITSAPSCSRPR